MDIRKLIEKGQDAQDAEHAAKEVKKRGNLRGGSSGIVAADGKIYGECHRIAMARMLGQDKKPDSNRSIMFNAGNGSEDIWAEKLTAAGVIFKREEEIPIVWKVPGTKKVVTGRPDFIVSDSADPFVPTYGLELKGVFSHSTAVGVELEGRPNSKNLVQAAFYSMALGDLPYVLCYTSASVIDLQYWAVKKFGGIKKLPPFYRFYYLEWRDGTLWYRDERATEAVPTAITHQGLTDYFTLITEMEATKVLGPRPTSDHVNGEPAKYKTCDYCDRKAACSKYDDDQDFDSWLNPAEGKT